MSKKERKMPKLQVKSLPGAAALLAAPLVLMDLYLRGMVMAGTRYRSVFMYLPGILFAVIWISLVVGFCMVLPKFWGRIVYGVLTVGTYVFFVANAVAYAYTGFCFSFTLMKMAGEGKGYIGGAVKSAGPLLFTVFFAVLLLIVTAILAGFPEKRISVKVFAITAACLLVLHAVNPMFYGAKADSLRWDAWRTPRNVYEAYNDKNKSLIISGLIEYTLRDFYLTFLKQEESMTDDEKEFLTEAFADQSNAPENEYTGLLRGKNVIFLQLEGIDDWLVTEETMPVLHGLLKESLNFTDHYSFFNGGGSTFNSEFAVNTGFITPLSYSRNAFTFNGNAFPYSMPRMFQAQGYTVNAFHMNSEEYYSRGVNYRAWGYDAYHGFLDRPGCRDTLHHLDRTLIEDEEFASMIFAADHPTVSYIITFTPHAPFDTKENDIGAFLAEEKYGAPQDFDEEQTAKLMGGETDKMIGLLLDKLRETGLYENTVIVGYADHYLYTIEDKDVIPRNKPDADTNLVNHTPFFIWSADLKPQEITKVNSQLDILPTVLNLMGIPYVKTNYMGSDVLSPDYEGFVVFPDTSVYDGKVYAENAEIVKGSASQEELTALLTKVNRLIRKNDLALKYDWFREH